MGKIKVDGRCYPNQVNGRCYPNYSTEALGTEFDKYDWSLILSKDNPNEQLNLKYEYLLKTANKLCPIKGFHITKKRPAFLTNELLELIKE